MILLSGVVGSTAYGLAREGSDGTVRIYALSDPRAPHDYRYVGRTVWTAEKRLKSHIQTAVARKADGTWRNAVTYRAAWIRSVIRDGYRPVITVLAETALDQRVFAEQQWIAALQEAGYRLTNGTPGGESPHLHKPTGQTRRRQSEANKRRFANNPLEREFYRQQMIRQFGSEEGRRYLSEKATAQWAVPAAREAQSARLTAICSDPEFVEERGKAISRMLRDTERGQKIRAASSQRLSGEGNHAAKLTWDRVRGIRAEYAAGGVTQKEIAARHGVEQSLVSQIVRHKIWVDATGESVPPPVPRKVFPQVTNELLGELVQVYRAALAGGQPSHAVARHFDISPIRAYGWIAKARERGLLGATTPGVAGEAAALANFPWETP